MTALVYILLAWFLTLLSCLCLGTLILRTLRLTLTSWEDWAYRFLLGAGALSLLTFTLAAAGLAYKGAVYAIAALLLVFTWRHRPQLPRLCWDATALAWLPLTFLYLTHALAPEHSPDGMSYHLGLVARYARDHALTPTLANMYGYLSQGLEMLFLHAFLIGRHSAAALVHFTFLLLLPLLLYIHAGTPGWRAGLFLYAIPVVGIDGISAYNDVALATVLFAVWHAMSRWRVTQTPAWLTIAALLAGFAFAIKFTGLIALLLLVPAWRTPRYALWALPSMLPWLARNALHTGNPLAPFSNAWFPNPHFNAEFEANYLAFLRHYDLSGPLEWARELLLGGPRLSGLLGPLALLLPLAFLGLRRHRSLLIAATLMLALYPLNVGTRFLIPALPFLGLALFLTFPRFTLPLPWLAAVLAWPSVLPLYASPYAWYLEKAPWRAALRIESEDGFLTRKSAGYITARLIEALVPPGESVFALSPIPESYTSRNVLIAYQSTLGLRLQHALAAPTYEGYQPRFRYDCPAGPLRIARDAADSWSINEIVPRPQRLDCHRHPWDATLAIDNNPVTRWRTWAPVRAGDACTPSPAQPYTVYGSADQWQVELAGCTRSIEALTGDYRAAARQLFLREGVRYLAIDAPDFPAADFRDHLAEWGAELLAERGTMRLYRFCAASCEPVP